MPDSWKISVGGRSYGPYALAQMQSFVIEGRLAAHSLVARNEIGTFRPATEDDELATLFEPVKTQTPSASGKFLTAGRTGGDAISTTSFGRGHDEMRSGERGRYLILADMKSRSTSGLVEEMQKLGPTLQLLPQAWLLVSNETINSIRNALVQKLGNIDVLFVVDATRNKAAWFNFGPEIDSRIRQIWSAQNEGAAARSAAG